MRSRARFDPVRRRAVLLPLSVAAVGGLGLAGCTAAKSAIGASAGSDVVAATSSPTPSTSASTASGQAPVVQPVYPPIVLTSSLGTKVRDVAFTEPLEVSLRGGSTAAHLQTVTLSRDGAAVAGTYDAARRAWKARDLAPAAGYTLTAVVADGSTTKSWKRTFSTIRPARTLTASVFPESTATVGVGIPIIVTFNHPVQDKVAVQKALEVTSSTSVLGAWHWDADDSVSYRPEHYWPGNIKVSVAARLAGVKAGEGLWGVSDLEPVSFSVGDSIVNKVNLAADVMQVVVNGRVARTVPVTGGQSGMNTRTGVSVISQKYADIQMDSESVGYAKGSANYYNLMVHWAMRITDSGEFLHAAPWSEWAQGHENVSHGCVGMSTDDAYWLYTHTNIGDVVEITGTTRPLEQGNGWTDWNMSWKDWLAGSALRAPQRT